MIIPIAKGQTFEYSLKEDAGEVKTVFALAYLDPLLRAHLLDSAIKVDTNPEDGNATGASVHASAVAYQTTKFALRGWKNFQDVSGNEVPCTREEVSVSGVGRRTGVTDESLALLSLETIRELAGAVVASNRLSEGERKN
jgi:hypothetical protein